MKKRRSSRRVKDGLIVVHRKRNYRAEYLRRIARAIAKGFSRQQARGHPKPGEASVSARRRATVIADERLQRGLRVLRQEKSLAAAARSAKVSPERLRTYAKDKGIIERAGRRWVVKHNLPRRMLIYSKGYIAIVTVGDFSSASLAGRYMAAVGRFVNSNDRSQLAPFVGQSLTDISGKTHPFETNPNALYRLTSAGGETFEQVYRIVV